MVNKWNVMSEYEVPRKLGKMDYTEKANTWGKK